MAVYYSGNQDFRGYLNDARNFQGSQGAAAKNLLNYVGNDGVVNQARAGDAYNQFKQIASDRYNTYNNLLSQQQAQNNSGAYSNGGGGSGSSAANGYTTGDVAYLDSQANDLRSLLGRTDTGLNQGLSQLNDDYQSNVNKQTSAQNQALQDLAEKGVADTQAKQGAYDTINQNAHTGYKSLAQIIGRASGTGSSAYQDLLPNIVGNDISGKRSVANTTYAQNAAQLAKAKQQDENSFASVLSDLASQRSKGEQQLRTGVEQQKQTLNQQLGGLLGQKAQALGGGYAEVKAAQAPTQMAIEGSRNAVDSFFNQFKSPIVAQQAALATPSLDPYTVDRSAVNAGPTAQGSSAADANPYTQILKKQLDTAAPAAV